MIEPLSDSAETEVRTLTRDYIDRAESLYGRRFANIAVHFDLKGSSAGLFMVNGKDCLIRYNPWIFAKYPRENRESTVPHEVAHYIVHRVHGMHRVKPHGVEWQQLMAAFEADASVTCNFDLEGIPRRQERRFAYFCDCRKHELSTRRHNAILRGKGRYECRVCRSELRQQAQANLL